MILNNIFKSRIDLNQTRFTEIQVQTDIQGDIQTHIYTGRYINGNHKNF